MANPVSTPLRLTKNSHPLRSSIVAKRPYNSKEPTWRLCAQENAPTASAESRWATPQLRSRWRQACNERGRQLWRPQYAEATLRVALAEQRLSDAMAQIEELRADRDAWRETAQKLLLTDTRPRRSLWARLTGR